MHKWLYWNSSHMRLTHTIASLLPNESSRNPIYVWITSKHHFVCVEMCRKWENNILCWYIDKILVAHSTVLILQRGLFFYFQYVCATECSGADERESNSVQWPDLNCIFDLVHCTFLLPSSYYIIHWYNTRRECITQLLLLSLLAAAFTYECIVFLWLDVNRHVL